MIIINLYRVGIVIVVIVAPFSVFKNLLVADVVTDRGKIVVVVI